MNEKDQNIKKKKNKVDLILRVPSFCIVYRIKAKMVTITLSCLEQLSKNFLLGAYACMILIQVCLLYSIDNTTYIIIYTQIMHL